MSSWQTDILSSIQESLAPEIDLETTFVISGNNELSLLNKFNITLSSNRTSYFYKATFIGEFQSSLYLKLTHVS